MDTPVALILFNRADLTHRVFSEIARAKPRQLFLIADGPREDHPDDQEKCAAARQVVEHVDWPCEVHTNFSDTNLGCGARPATGINWVFEHVDRAIILEDDCVPHPTFFKFCDELLERFESDERIMQISGQNLQFGQRRGPFSYFYSFHNICLGGFATWRRAWRHFDFGIAAWPLLRDTDWLHAIVNHPEGERYWSTQFDRAHDTPGEIDFWDYQWTFACWAQSGLTVLPNASLLTNIGHGPDGTHLHGSSAIANLALEAMEFPLQHPPYMARDRIADDFFVENVIVTKPKPINWRKRVRRAFPAPLRPLLALAARTARAVLRLRPSA